MFIGEVLSDFQLLLWPFASCIAIGCLGFALFGNKFLIIQKKKNQKIPMKSCPGGKAEVFPEGGLEFEPNCA